MNMLGTAKEFGQGFLARTKLAERFQNEDPAKALLAWIGTAIDNFLADSAGPTNAIEGWDVFLGWIEKHQQQTDLDLTRGAEQLLQRISALAKERLHENDRSRPVRDLRIVEPWIDEFFARERIA